MSGIDELESRFSNVVFRRVEGLRTSRDRIGGRDHHDELRARGVAAASGAIIACLEDHVSPEPRWARWVVEAHRLPHAAIGGAIENGIDRPLNWAAYFCDLGKYQNPVPDGESAFASVVNISYKRVALEGIRPGWQESFNETRVIGMLIRQGERLLLSPRIVVHQHRSDLQLWLALREFFVWGRSYARTRSDLISRRRNLLFRFLAPLLPGLLMLRMAARVIQRGRLRAAFVSALPFIAMLTVSWSWGECLGYWSARTAHLGAHSTPSMSGVQGDRRIGKRERSVGGTPVSNGNGDFPW
jgi:hypothetical protein